MAKFLAFISTYEQQLELRPIVIKIKEKAGRVHPLLEKYFWRINEIVFVAIAAWVLLYGYAWRAPETFPNHILVTVENGEHLGAIARDFESQNVINSSFWLKVFIALRGGERKVIAGEYYFPKAVNVFRVSKMLTRGEFGLSPIKVVIPEGFNSMEIADLLASSMPKFDKERFRNKAKDNEGYLFPDTYFLLPNAKPDDIIALMRENFTRRVNALKDDFEKFGKPMEDVIIMASIVEDEGRTMEVRRIIAGILWKRLKLKMPLQADATFKYYNGKTTFDLTDEDLGDEDNPYNTYKNIGLPPTAISNPGLSSIRAAVAPTNTDYLFFLSDKNGVTHYAVDFEGHKKNRELYLR